VLAPIVRLHSNSNPTDRVSASRAAGVAVVVAAALALSTVACSSSPRARYEVLSFFFDGVPDPDAVEDARGGEDGSAGGLVGPQPSFHQPVVDARCSECHGEGTGGEGRRSFRGGSWEAVQRAWKTCDTCHSDPAEVRPESIVIATDAYLHGPVALRDCQRCHHGHQSRYPSLLRTERAETICVTCHEGFGLREGGMAAMDCSACHDPHRAVQASDLFLRGGRAGACTRCHEIDKAARPWLHGPAAVGQCETCHDAHGTTGSERHVIRPLATVCLTCHDASVLPTAAGCATDLECDTCHEPHAAPRSSDLFLRDRIPAELPRFRAPLPPVVSDPEPATEPVDTPAEDAAAADPNDEISQRSTDQ